MAKLSLLKTQTGKKIKIIKRLSPYWKDLGYLLEFDDNGTEISVIEKRHHGDPDECCTAMFHYWLKGNGVKPHSWRKLIELIDDCDQQELADEIQDALLS